jgi:hypothetical protein
LGRGFVGPAQWWLLLQGRRRKARSCATLGNWFCLPEQSPGYCGLRSRKLRGSVVLVRLLYFSTCARKRNEAAVPTMCLKTAGASAEAQRRKKGKKKSLTISKWNYFLASVRSVVKAGTQKKIANQRSLHNSRYSVFFPPHHQFLSVAQQQTTLRNSIQ